MLCRFLPISLSLLVAGCQQDVFSTGQEADIVLGELGFNQSGGPLLFNHPKGIATDGTVLMMADGNNNRVLIWDTLPTSNVPPDIVLGQPDFQSNNSGEANHQLKWPADVAAADGKYLVADTYNHRILIWNTLPETNSTPDLILTGRDIPSTPDAEPRADHFAWPWGVWTDGTTLVVTSTSSGSADDGIRFGGWVLIWNTFPTSANQPADLVLSANQQMGTPRSITTDGQTFLIIGDHNAQNQSSPSGNWMWSTFPTESEQAPDGFLTEDMAMGWQAGDITTDGDLMMIGHGIHLWDGIPQNANTPPAFSIDGREWELRGGDGSTVAVAGDTVYVSDYNTNRIVGFHQPPTSANSIPDFVIGAEDLKTNTLRDNHFINNGIPLSLEDGGLIIGDGLHTQLNCWTETPTQSGQAPDQIIDIQDEVIALSQHDGTIVVAGKQDGLKIWNTGSPCDGNDPDITLQSKIGSIDANNLQSIALDNRYFYLLDSTGTLHLWKDIPKDGESPLFSRRLNTFEGILYSDGEYLSISGMDNFKFMKVKDIADDMTLLEFTYSERPQMIGHGIINNNQVFISDLNNHRILIWQDIASALDGLEPDTILGANDLDDTDPDKTKAGLFWPLRLDVDGDRLWVGEYKFSGRVLSYSVARAQ